VVLSVLEACNPERRGERSEALIDAHFLDLQVQ
jgi:hypothetical protein